MNKSQAEKKNYAFHAVFRVDVKDVKPFQNLTETSPFDHFLDPQSMPRLFKTINRWLIQTLLLLTLFQQCYDLEGEPGGNRVLVRGRNVFKRLQLQI